MSDKPPMATRLASRFRNGADGSSEGRFGVKGCEQTVCEQTGAVEMKIACGTEKPLASVISKPSLAAESVPMASATASEPLSVAFADYRIHGSLKPRKMLPASSQRVVPHPPAVLQATGIRQLVDQVGGAWDLLEASGPRLRRRMLLYEHLCQGWECGGTGGIWLRLDVMRTSRTLRRLLLQRNMVFQFAVSVHFFALKYLPSGPPAGDGVRKP
jgi:hypothetical protein